MTVLGAGVSEVEIPAGQSEVVYLQCCVEGCEEPAKHGMRFTIARDGWGETEAGAVFCCPHFDQFLAEREPFLDLALVAKVRNG